MASGGSMKFGQNIESARYRHIVTTCGRNVMAGVVEVLLLEYSKKTIFSEQLQDIGIYSQFKKKERDEIDKNEPLATNDITFLYSVCEKLWRKVSYPHDRLKDLVWKIKAERNKVSHEDLSLTTAELETKLKEFEITLKDALKEAETLYPNHKSALTALESDIDHSWGDLMIKVREELDPNSPEDYQLNKEEQEKFRPKATKCIQDKSRVELMAKLKSSSKVLLLDWLGRYEAIDPSNIAVSLQMAKDDKFHSSPQSSKPTIIDQKEILKAKDKSGSEATAVIISGDAGAGKSTLLSCVVEKWIKGKTDDFSGLCDYALLFYMEFRKSKFDNLDDYLQDLLLGVISEYDFRTVKSSIVDSCIFLCDGFDERNEKSVKLFQDILDLKAVNQKILITTRPINTIDLTEIVNKCKKSRVNVCLMGIPEKSVIQAIQKLVKQRVPDVSQRQQMIDSLTETYHSMAPALKELTRIPLYNNLIFELMMEDPELRTSINTVTRLFAEIKKHDRKRLLNKFEHPDKESEMSKFEKLYRKISLKNHLDSKHEIDEMDIKMFKEECKTLEPYFGDIMSSYFNTKHSVKSLDLEKVFCYKHRTEQEFAAAQAISDMLVNEDGVYDSVHEGNSGNIIMRCLSEVKPQDERSAEDTQKSVHNILVFVSGILHSLKLIDKYIRDIIDFVWLELDTPTYIDPLLDHLLEADNSTTVSEAISARLQDGNHDKWSVSKSKTMCSLTTLLSSHIKPKSLIFAVHDDPETNPHLIPAIRKASSQQIDFDLCMWCHYLVGISGYSDMFLYEAKSVKVFVGNLSLSGLSLIPDNIKILNLQLDRQTLPAFWNHVTSLTELGVLGLRIKLDFDPKDINPLPYKGYSLRIAFDLEGRNGDPSARPCAEILNSLWPRVQNSRHKKFLMLGTRWVPNMRSKEERRSQDSDDIYIDKSGFTSDGVEEFIRAVKVKNLKEITFWDTVNITEEEQSRLRELGRDIGVTTAMGIR